MAHLLINLVSAEVAPTWKIPHREREWSRNPVLVQEMQCFSGNRPWPAPGRNECVEQQRQSWSTRCTKGLPQDGWGGPCSKPRLHHQVMEKPAKSRLMSSWQCHRSPKAVVVLGMLVTQIHTEGMYEAGKPPVFKCHMCISIVIVWLGFRFQTRTDPKSAVREWATFHQVPTHRIKVSPDGPPHGTFWASLGYLWE